MKNTYLFQVSETNFSALIFLDSRVNYSETAKMAFRIKISHYYLVK